MPITGLPSLREADLTEFNKIRAEEQQDTSVQDESPEESADTATQQEQENIQEQTQQATPVSDKGKENFRILRERAESAERERALLMQRLQELESKQQSVSEPEDIGIAPDALAEGKHLAQIYKRMKQMESQISNYQKQTAQNVMEAQLKAQYPDFDAVVSKDNIEALRASHPTIAQALATAAASDAYSAASSAYTIIKEMGISKFNQEASMTRQLIKENAHKPRSAQSASPQRGNSPLNNVNQFIRDGLATDEYQEALRKEMHQARMSIR